MRATNVVRVCPLKRSITGGIKPYISDLPNPVGSDTNTSLPDTNSSIANNCSSFRCFVAVTPSYFRNDFSRFRFQCSLQPLLSHNNDVMRTFTTIVCTVGEFQRIVNFYHFHQLAVVLNSNTWQIHQTPFLPITQYKMAGRGAGLHQTTLHEEGYKDTERKVSTCLFDMYHATITDEEKAAILESFSKPNGTLQSIICGLLHLEWVSTFAGITCEIRGRRLEFVV